MTFLRQLLTVDPKDTSPLLRFSKGCTCPLGNLPTLLFSKTSQQVQEEGADIGIFTDDQFNPLIDDPR